MNRDELRAKVVEALNEAADCWECCGSEGFSTYTETLANYVLDVVVPFMGERDDYEARYETSHASRLQAEQAWRTERDRAVELEADRDRWKDMHHTLSRDLAAGDA